MRSDKADNMKCKHYKTWIIDLALGGSEKQNAVRQAELQGHLAACPRCREAFESERRLRAAIDGALRRHLTAEPSPQFAVRVQQEIAVNAGRSRTSRWPLFHAPRWIAAAVVCAIVLTAGVIWKTRSIPLNRSRGAAIGTTRTEKPRIENLQYSGLEAKESPRSSKKRLTVAAPPPAEMAAVNAATKMPHRSLRMRTNGQAKQQTPQVLVPKDQMALVLQLYYGTRTGVIDGASLVATPPGFKREPDGTLVPAPIEIKPIVIAKLSPASGPADEP